jgi:hypothetical protein
MTMTTKRTYQCNVCGSEIKNGVIGRGLKWVGSEEIEWTTVQQSENHICDRCCNALQAAFRGPIPKAVA